MTGHVRKAVIGFSAGTEIYLDPANASVSHPEGWSVNASDANEKYYYFGIVPLSGTYQFIIYARILGAVPTGDTVQWTLTLGENDDPNNQDFSDWSTNRANGVVFEAPAPAFNIDYAWEHGIYYELTQGNVIYIIIMKSADDGVGAAVRYHGFSLVSLENLMETSDGVRAYAEHLIQRTRR
jgi:hypothetical protein